jgi:hypothetical protein
MSVCISDTVLSIWKAWGTDLPHSSLVQINKIEDALLTAEQENIALKLRVLKLENDMKRAESEKTLLELKLKCYESECKEYKYQLKKSEKENKRLHMLLEDAERTYSSDQ